MHLLLKEDLFLVKKKAPLITDEQIDDLLNQFGTYSKDSSIPNESDDNSDWVNRQSFHVDEQNDHEIISDKSK